MHELIHHFMNIPEIGHLTAIWIEMLRILISFLRFCYVKFLIVGIFYWWYFISCVRMCWIYPENFSSFGRVVFALRYRKILRNTRLKFWVLLSETIKSQVILSRGKEIICKWNKKNFKLVETCLNEIDEYQHSLCTAPSHNCCIYEYRCWLSFGNNFNKFK